MLIHCLHVSKPVLNILNSVDNRTDAASLVYFFLLICRGRDKPSTFLFLCKERLDQAILTEFLKSAHVLRESANPIAPQLCVLLA